MDKREMRNDMLYDYSNDIENDEENDEIVCQPLSYEDKQEYEGKHIRYIETTFNPYND